MLDVQKLAVDSFEVNSQNGWHKEGRTFEEIGALIGSEVAEALEDHRNGHAPTKEWYTKKAGDGSELRAANQYDPTWKPEGIPSELADIIIRIGDAAGLYGWGGELEMVINEIRNGEYGAHPMAVDSGDSFGTAMGKLFSQIGEVIGFHTQKFDGLITLALGHLWLNVESVAVIHHIDLERAIKEKLAHNRTRGYKHGGKVI